MGKGRIFSELSNDPLSKKIRKTKSIYIPICCKLRYICGGGVHEMGALLNLLNLQPFSWLHMPVKPTRIPVRRDIRPAYIYEF